VAPQLKMKQVAEDIYVGAQPQAGEIEQLAQLGIRTVINLRVSNEENEALAPENEAKLVRDQGMEYVHLPVVVDQIRPEQVDDFRNFVHTLEHPVFVHCKGGTRAGAFAMMHCAVEEGWSGEQTLEEATKAGFKCDQPALKQFITQYVDSHERG